MGKSLIIVESPAKVKTIKKFLGPGYLVQASVGHIRDLPKSNIGVDEANDFAPEYEIIQGKEKVVQSLRDAASKVDTVFLAPDPDREGEAIAWHVAELLKDKKTTGASADAGFVAVPPNTGRAQGKMGKRRLARVPARVPVRFRGEHRMGRDGQNPRGGLAARLERGAGPAGGGAVAGV